jgi:hypothetical protein
MSKGGISFTVGTKGYHLNFSKRGVRQTVGLPGSGISDTSYLVKNEPESETKRQPEAKRRNTLATTLQSTKSLRNGFQPGGGHLSGLSQ